MKGNVWVLVTRAYRRRHVRALVLIVAAIAALLAPAGPAAAATSVGDVKLVRLNLVVDYQAVNLALKVVDNPNGYEPVYNKPYLNTVASKWQMRVHYMSADYWIVSFKNTYYANACLDKEATDPYLVYLYPCHYRDNQLWRIWGQHYSVPGADVFKIQNKQYGRWLSSFYTDRDDRVFADDAVFANSYAITVIG